jgi:hypothetical protein
MLKMWLISETYLIIITWQWHMYYNKYIDQKNNNEVK